MDYKEKYLKYKKKYIDLKNIKGGNFITFEADENKYKIDNNKTGLFNGELFIDGIAGIEIIKMLYKGKWDNIKQGYHYFGLFKNIKKSKIIKEYKIDCVGEFNKEGKNIIFSGIYSDKITNKDFSNYINKPINGYKPDNGEYRPIDELINDNLKFFKETNKKSYLKEILFYQENWYYFLPNNEKSTLLEKIINGYNAINVGKIDSNKNIEDVYNSFYDNTENTKNIYDLYISNVSNDNLFKLCSLLLNVNIVCITEIHNEGKYDNIDIIKDDLSKLEDDDFITYNYFYYYHKIYTVEKNIKTEKYFNNKTIIFYEKKNIYYNLFNNDDVIKYNLIIDLNYNKRIKNTEIIYQNFGIGNRGNTCYLNACLQFFIHCPPFLKYLNEIKNKKKLNDFYKIKDIDIIFNNGIDLENFYNNRSNIHKIQDLLKLGISEQEDSELCITRIFDVLEEIERLYDVNIEINYDNIKYPYYNIILKNINNPIKNIFKFYCTSSIFCGDKIVSESYNEFFILNLDLTKNIVINDKGDQIEQYTFELSKFFVLEKIDIAEPVKQCTFLQTTNNFKQFKLYYLSEIFIISLKRWNSVSGTKIYDKINIPLEIDLQENLHDKYIYTGSTRYKLISYIVQGGGAGGGHYWSYSYIEKENTWYKYNDSYKGKVNGTPELADAYVLMYQRIN